MPFSPTDIAGIAGWWDASQITGKSDGDSVTSWTDFSGASHPASTLFGTAPVYKTNMRNGLPAIQFSTNGALDATSSMAADGVYTIAWVIQHRASTGTYQFPITNQSPTAHTGGAAGIDGSNTRGIYGPGVFVSMAGGTYTQTTWERWILTANGTTITLHVDGVLKQTYTGTFPAGGTIRIGAASRTDNTNAEFHANANIGEVIAYDGALSSTDRDSLDTYLAVKWGWTIGGTVAATLPSLTASATGTTPVSYASKVLDRSPLGWWRLSEASGTTMTDSSGLGHHGTYSGSPTLGVADSPLVEGGGTVANFDGTDDVGSVAYATWMNQADFSIALWIKTTTTATGIMAARDHIDGYPWQIAVNVSATAIYFPVQGTDTSGTYPAQTDVSANNGSWRFVVGTYNDTTKVVKTYIDGSLIAQATATSNINLTSYFGYGMAIGRRGAGSPVWYTGKLAEVAFFGSTLSAADIEDLYTAATTTGDADGTVATTLPSLTASVAGDVTPPQFTGTAATTLPSLSASVTGTFTSNDRDGTISATLPSLTASLEGTHTSNDQVGTVDATLPSLTATVAGDYTPATITGDAAATLPPLSASVAGFVTSVGEVHATLPALTASIVDAGANRTGTVAATLPSLSAGVVGTAPTLRAEPWTADLSQRTLLALVASGSAQSVPPLAVVPDAVGAERPLLRRSRVVPNLATEPAARMHPVSGRITVPDDVYDAYPVTREILGVPHILIDGVDVTYFRDSRTQIGEERAQEPFGDMSLDLSFPQITTLDDADDPELSWMRNDASVHLVMQEWDEDGPTGVVSTLFHGRLVSDDSGNDSSRPQKDWLAQGTMWQAASFQHQVRPIVNPVDIGTQIPKVLNGVTSHRYPTIANASTGIRTRQRGNNSDKVLGYVQGLLADSFTEDGRQLTLAKKPGTVNTYELRWKKTGSQWTVTNGQRGLEVSLSSDSTQSRNVIWGRGQRSDGGVWMNKRFPDAGQTAPQYPFSSPGTVMTVGTTDADTSTGNGVTTWQKRARTLGYSVAIDGVYNSADAAVARKLQKQYGILVDGIVGPQTWAETFDVGALGADPDSWVRLPLAADPRTQPILYRANGSVIGPNPDYDPSVTIVSDDIDFGTDVDRATGEISAAQIIDRESPPPLSGRLTFKTDPREGSRMNIEAGDRITLIGYEGRNVVLHAADRARNWADKTVTVQVAETAYDALTLAQIRARNNAARPDLARRPGKIKQKPSIDPWDCESNAGKIERHALYGGLWTVIRIPMSEYGRLSMIDLSTSPNSRFSTFLFARPITSAQMIRYVGANPLALDSPGETNRKLLEDQFGWLEGWGRSGDACGYYPGSEGTGAALSGNFMEAGVDYWSPDGYLYIAEYSASSTFIEGEMRAAPPEE